MNDSTPHPPAHAPWCLENVRVLQPGRGIAADAVTVVNGRIAALRADALPQNTVERIDGHGALLTPGLIDLHTHGIGAQRYEFTPEGLIEAAQIPPQFGTTTVLPTLYRCMKREKLALMESLADALDDSHGLFPGFHLEGPFLAMPGAGSDTTPGDVVLLDEILDAARGRTLAMSISPDTPNILPVIERLAERGVAVFITHTQATVEQTQAAIDAGARHATHFYDVFFPPKNPMSGVRSVGAVEAILADPRVSVDFIADGVHVHPAAIRAAVAAKPPDKVALITDSNVGAGLPPGLYDTPWGYQVRTHPDTGARREAPGTPQHMLLTGSVITMNQGIRKLLHWEMAAPPAVWAMGTVNAAATIPALARKGRLDPGADADLVLWDETLQPLRTWIQGIERFHRTPD